MADYPPHSYYYDLSLVPNYAFSGIQTIQSLSLNFYASDILMKSTVLLVGVALPSRKLISELPAAEDKYICINYYSPSGRYLIPCCHCE